MMPSSFWVALLCFGGSALIGFFVGYIVGYYTGFDECDSGIEHKFTKRVKDDLRT